MSERFTWIYDKVKRKKIWVADMWARKHILTLQVAVSSLTSDKFANISGALPSNSNPSTTAAYPSGFTQSNCVITGFVVKQASGDWQVGDVGASLTLGPTGYSTSCTASGLYGKSWKAVLMRTDI